MAWAVEGGVPGGRLLAKARNEPPPPVAAAVPNFVAIAVAWAFGMPAAVMAVLHPLLKLLVTIAPRRAIPNTPPISRLVFVAADATPAWRVPTDPITAAAIAVL